MKKMNENLLLIFRCSSLFIFLLLSPQTCHCMNSHICSASACGNIGNISYPFRLKNDPQHCGDPSHELECENNVTTILNLNSKKYKVKSINYFIRSIWLVDASVNNYSICSFPNVSLNNYFQGYYPYTYMEEIYEYIDPDQNICNDYRDDTPINFMRCPYALKNSTLFIELPSHCNSNSSARTYIKIGNMNASYVGDNCTLYPTMLTSWNFSSNVSVSEIQHSLFREFQLSWILDTPCGWCNARWTCPNDDGEIVETCSHSLRATLQVLWDHINTSDYTPYVRGPPAALVLIVLLILVVVFAGVSIPAKIIFGFASASAFLIFEITLESLHLNVYWPLVHLPFIIGLFFTVRFIIVFPCFIWIFIYKFRRRHLSRYAAIEDFLQSENNFMPIRYSYSDIKKMTRGFRDKLGQGGYGTVYKGKLRSGYDVAIKLLGKPGGNGQDFMNEIATIGRIHHVNIVKLVGYCAERSKRALMFDYMPNGSLDKFIYSQEKSNCLSWERRHEIAIGVARGIEYLHRGCDIQILHFDIKPHNILLDDNFTPKITDFGLAKFFSPEKKVVTMTAIRGTIGYVAPELINRGFGEVSYKADVYSFGMLLMEMVGLNKHLKGNNQASSQYFPDWIYDCFEQGHDIEIEELIDENDNGTNKDIAKKMTIVALWCIQTSPGDRPSMNKVVEMLEAKVERLRVPNRPSELARVAVSYEDQSLTTYSTDSVTLVPHDATPSVEITVED